MDYALLPNDCTAYYRCKNGIRTTVFCPLGTVFDTVNRVCGRANEISGLCSSASSGS